MVRRRGPRIPCMVRRQWPIIHPRPPPTPGPTHRPQGIKRKLEAATSVSEKRMKLLGLKVRH